MEDMIWSYSRVTTFYKCPYMFFLRYIAGCKEKDQFFSSYGSWVHKLIERFYKGEIKRESLTTNFLIGFQTNVKGKRPNANLVQRYIEEGTKYFDNFQPFPFETVGVEDKVDFDLNGIKVTGVIDYIGVSNGEYLIVDHKSTEVKPRGNRKKPTNATMKLDEMLRQLYIYSTAVKNKFGKFPKSLCFNCFKAGTFVEEPFNIETYNQTIKWFQDAVEEIKNTNEFIPNIEWFQCNYICGVCDECMYKDMG